jgi:two-component sensor histidine kinase
VEIRTRREGSFGAISSDAATPLAMVFTELIQNAVEHAFAEEFVEEGGGSIVVRSERRESALLLVVEDDGVGLPAGFDLEATDSLGLSIVRTLVGELGGRLSLGLRADGPGTRVEVDLPRVSPAHQ